MQSAAFDRATVIVADDREKETAERNTHLSVFDDKAMAIRSCVGMETATFDGREMVILSRTKKSTVVGDCVYLFDRIGHDHLSVSACGYSAFLCPVRRLDGAFGVLILWSYW